MKPRLLTSPSEAVNFLHEKFGVTKEQALQVVRAGVAGRNGCTPSHPKGAPGTMCYLEATRELRDVFIPLGYESDNTDNIASVWNRERGIKIAICNSDAGTGVAHDRPQPINGKGDGAKRAVSSNEGVFKDILESALNETKSVRNDGDTFWYLCIYCDDENGYRAELCCPILEEDGSFKDFLYHRILLSDDGTADGGLPVRHGSPDEDSGFDVPVTRRQVSA